MSRTASTIPLFHSIWILCVALLLVFGTHSLWVWLEVSPVNASGQWDLLWDPDSYARLLRVQQLYQGGNWYDNRVLAFNAPDGMALHWTRPLDLLLLAGAATGALLTSFDQSLHITAIVLGPLLQALGVLLLSWGWRRELPWQGLLLFVLLFLLQRGTAFNFVAGFPDHHGLQLLLMLAVMASLVRGCAQQQQDSPWIIGGLFAALGLWVGVESLLFIAAALMTLALWWILYGAPWRVRWLRFSTALAVATLLALAIEHPPQQWFSVNYSRLSLPHVVLLLLALLAPIVLGAADRRWGLETIGRRSGAVIVVGVLLLGVYLPFFPYIVAPYSASTSPFIQQLLPHIYAEQSFWPQSAVAGFNFILEVGPLVLIAPFLFWRLCRAPLQCSPRWWLYGVWVTVSLGYGMYSSRGVPFMVLAYLPVWVEMLSWLAGLSLRAWRLAQRGAAVLQGGVLMLTLAGHWIAAALLVMVMLPGLSLKNLPSYNYSELLPYLEPTRSNYQELILADLFDGPEIAYKTGYGVLGAPYHEEVGSSELAYQLFGADPDRADIQQQFRQRQIRYIVMPGAVVPRYRSVVMQPGTLLGRLVRGHLPQWLTRVPLPNPLAQRYLLFQVRLP